MKIMKKITKKNYKGIKNYKKKLKNYNDKKN